jgi:hypothetical protein
LIEGRRKKTPKQLDESTFDKWYTIHRAQYDNRFDAYKSWEGDPFEHVGESKFDRYMRLSAWSAEDARREWASGGYDMYKLPEGGPVLKEITATGVREIVTTEAEAVSEYTKVGRWMSREELEAMMKSGKVQEGAGGLTFVATDGPGSFTAAPAGSVYVEFEVPTNSLLQGGKANWFKLIGPNASKTMQFMLQKQGGEMLPSVRNLTGILDLKLF